MPLKRISLFLVVSTFVFGCTPLQEIPPLVAPKITSNQTSCYPKADIEKLQKLQSSEGLDWIQRLTNLIRPSKPINFKSSDCKIVFFAIPNEIDSTNQLLNLLDVQFPKNLEIPGFKYEFYVACEQDQFRRLGNPQYLDSSQRNKLISKNMLEEIVSLTQKKTCKRSISALNEVIQYLSSSLKDKETFYSPVSEKLFIIIQIPWKDESNNSEIRDPNLILKLEQYKRTLDSIPNKDRIAGIYLVGNTSTFNGHVSRVFHSVGNRVEAPLDMNTLSARIRSKIEEN